MQIASPVECRVPSVSVTGRRFQRSQILLIGFDDATNRTLSNYLSALSFEVQESDEPYSGLSALIEAPSVWMTCVVNARAFGSDSAFQRYVQLYAFETDGIDMILGNSDASTAEPHDIGPIPGIASIVGDITDAAAFDAAVTTVMTRRGYLLDRGKPMGTFSAGTTGQRPTPVCTLDVFESTTSALIAANDVARPCGSTLKIAAHA